MANIAGNSLTYKVIPHLRQLGWKNLKLLYLGDFDTKKDVTSWGTLG